MNITHEILKFNPEFGSIEVKYTSDTLPEGLVYNIDLPIVDGNYPTPEELESIIIGHNPVWQLDRLVALQTVVVPAYLSALVESTPPVQEGTV